MFVLLAMVLYILLLNYGFWLSLWYLLSSVTPLVSSGYPFGIFWLPLWYLLVTPLVSSGYPFGIFWLTLWYLLVNPLVSSGYPFGIFWLPLWYLLVTPLVSSGYPFGIFWLPLWYLLVTPLVSSGYLFGIFWLPLWYLLVTPLVSSGYPFGIFWLPLWYLLVTPLVSSGYLFGIFWLPFGIFWLPLWYLLVTPLVSSGYPFGIFWLTLWYLLVTPLVSSGYPFGIFWLPLWYLLVTSLVSSGYPFGIFWLPLWNEHLENMITNITKHLGILRKLKFSLNRSNLEKMYLVYIRPLFEYACEVWDNCGIGYSDKLEKLQLDAARIVTGLPIFTKSEYLYAETGWETLSERRYRRKLQFFFNIKCGMAPEYLRHQVPPTIQSTTIYPLRNGDHLIVPFCRLSITNSSFIPSTVKEWNKLDIAIRKLDSLSKFKNAIRINSQSNKISVPKLYYYGPRKLYVILTQIRCTASFLNHDLHKVHILSSPACSCGAPQEDANHFFFVCTKYSEIRNELFLSISDLSQSINTSLLTSGSETLSYADNCFIFDSVFRFIKRSKRFLIV